MLDTLIDEYDKITLDLYELINSLVKEYNTRTGNKDRRAWMKTVIEQLIEIRGANESELASWKLKD